MVLTVQLLQHYHWLKHLCICRRYSPEVTEESLFKSVVPLDLHQKEAFTDPSWWREVMSASTPCTPTPRHAEVQDVRHVNCCNTARSGSPNRLVRTLLPNSVFNTTYLRQQVVFWGNVTHLGNLGSHENVDTECISDMMTDRVSGLG